MKCSKAKKSLHECDIMVEFEVIKDEKKCELLWKRFFKPNLLFDVWEYRKCFFNKNHHSLHFIVGKIDDNIVGLIPLWKNDVRGFYEFFGGEITERNSIFISDKRLVQEFIEQLPQRTYLDYMEKGCIDTSLCNSDDTRFFLPLAKFDYSVENYLKSFGSKHRQNIKYDIRKLQSWNYEVSHNNIEHITRLIELNMARFGSDSFFAEEYFTSGFSRFIELAHKRGELQLISIVIDGVAQAIDAAIFYNGIYYVITGGANLEISNIGKLLILEHIKNAGNLKADVVDFLTDDGGWKKLWNLNEDKCYGYMNSTKDLLRYA